MILNGFTSAANVGSLMLRGSPSMYKFVELLSCKRSMRALNESDAVSSDSVESETESVESEMPFESETDEGTEPYAVPGIL